MDRRSWPWKKKSSDKAGTASEVVASQGDQGNNKRPSYIQISFEQYSLLTAVKDEVKTFQEQVQKLEDEIKDLNEKLSAANAEITTKDSLVKQHTKVAEEAVSGWEKAEAEASALKTHLESVTLSKLTAEDRAAHLDGALKECMRQIRSLKEENEQKLQDVVLTKTKQLDKLKVEFEAKIADFEQELLRSAAENDALSRSLQERSNMLIRISEEKSQAESEIQHLKNNIESCEREINSLKYELHVISKELEIRNEEKNMSMRTAEAANKQHMEGVKKIAKLEAECQRLRGLVRKKLPGPAALAQMKMEVESLGRDYGDSRLKRSPVKPSSPLMSPMSHVSQPSDFSLDTTQKFHKENEVLTERVLAMEEEKKMLKEALAKRNSELQVSRNLCAKTANRLQALEAQMMNKSPTSSSVQIPSEIYSSQNASNPPSLASMSEDGNDDARSFAGSWSTAVMSELSQPNRHKNSVKMNKAESVNHLELMDDFLEMEKLACLSNDSNANGSTDVSDSPNNKRQDMVNSDHACANFNPEQPSVMQLQKRISNMLQSVPKDAEMDKILVEIQTIIKDACSTANRPSETHASPGGLVVSEDTALTAEKEIAMSNESMAQRDVVKVISQDLADAISQIHDFVLFLSKEARAFQDASSESKMFGRKIKEFSVTFDKVLCNEKTLVDFIFDLSSILAETSELKIDVLGFNASEVEIHSPDCIDKVALPENKVVRKDSSGELDQNGCSHVSATTSDPEVPDDGNLASGYEPKGAACKFSSEEFEELKLEKEKVETNLACCTGILEATKSQLHETEQLLAEVKSQLASAQKSNSLAETQLKCMAESYRSLETRSAELETEVGSLKGKIESLENKLQDEKLGHREALAKCQELEEQLQRKEDPSACSAADSDLKSKQDKELAAAAEKLAECQETILLLGKQLKSLRPQAEQIGSSPYHETTQKPHDEPTTTSNGTNAQNLDQTETETAPTSANTMNSPRSASDNETPVTTMRSPVMSKHPAHRHTKSGSSSSLSGLTPEKHSRGFSRFFSSKGK